MRTITRIDAGSAFRVGAVLYTILFAIFGLISLVFQALLLAPLMNSAEVRGSADLSFFAGFSLLSLACVYLVGLASAAIFGGISGAIFAWAYNLSARWVGGLKVRFDSDSGDLIDEIGREMDLKRKRGEL